MTVITITIPNGFITPLLDAFDSEYPGRPEGTTKAQWAKQKVRNYVRETYRSYKAHQAEPVVQTASNQANTESDIITIE
jgi:hypothetical protein